MEREIALAQYDKAIQTAFREVAAASCSSLFAAGAVPPSIAARLTGFAQYVQFEDVRGAGINDANVTEIIDHHLLVGGLKTRQPIEITIKPVASTAT